MFDNIKSDAFKGVFDPANFVQCGCVTYPNAWNLLKEHIVYMHIKDAKNGKRRCCSGWIRRRKC
ncbi:MAG: sugar phosphate isomerase/epimerase [Clostridiales bacterium]|nr:MAG: sugar phosphate isomerase/epimerase [Clostridiales bacterium]